MKKSVDEQSFLGSDDGGNIGYREKEEARWASDYVFNDGMDAPVSS